MTTLQLVIRTKLSTRGTVPTWVEILLTIRRALVSEAFGVAAMPITTAFRLLLGIRFAPAAPTSKIRVVNVSLSADYTSYPRPTKSSMLRPHPPTTVSNLSPKVPWKCVVKPLCTLLPLLRHGPRSSV